MQERPLAEQDHHGFVLRILGNKTMLSALLGDEKHLHLLGPIRREISHFSSWETTRLTGVLLTGIGSYDAVWDIHRRRSGAVNLLRQIPFDQGKVDPSQLAELYLDQLKLEGKSAKPKERVNSLIDAGFILAPHLPLTPKTVTDISEAMDAAVARDLRADRDMVRTKAKLETLKDRLVNPPDAKETSTKKDDIEDPVAQILKNVLSKGPREGAILPMRDKKQISNSNDIEPPLPNIPGTETHWDPKTPETQLVAAAKHEDRGAFEALVNNVKADIYTLAYRLTGNEDDARDVMQDAYLRAFRGIKRFRGDARFSTWMHRITANAAATHMAKRSKGRTEELIEDTPLPDPRPENDPEAMTEAGALRDRVTDALTDLPPRLRAVVVLRDVYDLPHEAIARVLGISEAAAKVRLHRARRKLREQLFPMPGEEKARATDFTVPDEEL